MGDVIQMSRWRRVLEDRRRAVLAGGRGRRMRLVNLPSTGEIELDEWQVRKLIYRLRHWLSGRG